MGAANPSYASVDGVLYNKAVTTLIQYPCGKTGAFTIPSTIKSIGDVAFFGNSAITSVTIPNSVTNIGDQAFSACIALTIIDVDSGNLNYAGVDGVLYNKAGTTLIQCPGGKAGAFSIPIGVTFIGLTSFQSCSALTSVTIPNSVTTIGGMAFYSCTSLASITFQGLVAPTTVGTSWITDTPAGIRGHAYAASNFPSPGGVWNGLTMGDLILATPGAPTGLVVNPGNNQVTLRWDAPLDNGGVEIDHYIVYMNGTDVAHVEGTMKIITGLTNGVSYDFAVAAHTIAGIGPKSESVSATPGTPLTLVLPPNAPTNLIAVPGDGQVQLSWADPNDDGGSPITGYKLSWSLTIDGPYSSTIISGTSFLHEGIENGQIYYYNVAAINAIGESNKTEVVSAKPMATITLPIAPTNLIASVNNGNVSLTWSYPSDDGQISNYQVYRGTSSPTIGLLTTTAGTAFLDTNVFSNQTYYYQVSAVNAGGEGERSVEVNVTVPANNPPAPDPSPPFYETLEGQVAIVGTIAGAGVGVVLYTLWRWRRA